MYSNDEMNMKTNEWDEESKKKTLFSVHQPSHASPLSFYEYNKQMLKLCMDSMNTLCIFWAWAFGKVCSCLCMRINDGEKKKKISDSCWKENGVSLYICHFHSFYSLIQSKYNVIFSGFGKFSFSFSLCLMECLLFSVGVGMS